MNIKGRNVSRKRFSEKFGKFGILLLDSKISTSTKKDGG
ncbi:MAG: hypothetical protein ACJAW3_000464 [Lentimonas sp.]